MNNLTRSSNIANRSTEILYIDQDPKNRGQKQSILDHPTQSQSHRFPESDSPYFMCTRAKQKRSFFQNMYKTLEMWWLIRSVGHQTSKAAGPGFETGISHNEPDALQDHYEIM